MRTLRFVSLGTPRGNGVPLMTLFLCLSLTATLPQNVAAKPPFPQVVEAVYHPKPGGAIDKAAKACALCHAGPPQLNPYGRDLKAALRDAKTQQLTAAVLQSLESKDSDGDGFTDAAEFAADTLPGDPASKPAGQPPAPPTPGGTSPAPPSAPASPATNLFSLKSFLYPGHGQHPIIVHFPIGLFMISLLFDILGYRKKNAALTTAAYFNLLVATFSAPLAIATGLLAWRFRYGGILPSGLLLYHLVLGCVTTSFLGILLLMRFRQKGPLPEKRATLYFTLAFITFFTLTITGHLGGLLVYGD